MRIDLENDSKIPSVTGFTVFEDEMETRRTEFSIHLPQLHLFEREFLQLVSEGNVKSVENYIEDHKGLNVNCVNFQGITALQMAVRNQQESMVRLLLRQPSIEVGDAVLHAVRENNMEILVMLLDAQKKISPGLEFSGTGHSTEFPCYVTPLILACQMDNYDMVKLLISRGHTVSRPHSINCACPKCKHYVFDDPLYASSARLSVYKAISSPVFLIQETADPILSAFLLSADLEANSEIYIHLARSYLKLRDKVSAFAVDLLGCCRTSEEVELIMRQYPGSSVKRPFVFPRLLMAVEYRQKQFVAHPYTQQVLESHWSGDWHEWKNACFVKKAFIFLTRVIIVHFILLLCVIAPRSRLVKHWRIPLNKLITHASAYFVFLTLVFYISNQDKTHQTQGPPNTGAEAPLILYVLGYTWSAIRMCLMQGPRRYFSEMWNWAEIIMLSLFFITFSLWFIAAIDEVTCNSKNSKERKYWKQYDPTLLAEGTFCLATIFAYLRLMLFCRLNYHLGPLQVSLGKMIVDIYKYTIVFSIIVSAFGAGLAHLYQYYEGMVYEDEFGMKTMQVSSFTSLPDTLKTLFWALFCMAPLESADVVLENIKVIGKMPENRHGFTERVGYFCFGTFEVISVIVVLNMLIATMSNTFQRVTNNVATEWTFGRTQVYVDCIWQTTLPPPYNMIPTALAMSDVLEWIRGLCPNKMGVRARCSLSHCCYIERDEDPNVQRELPALMSVLVQRYFRDKASILRQEKSTERDLDAIKRELSTVKSLLKEKKDKKVRLSAFSETDDDAWRQGSEIEENTTHI